MSFRTLAALVAEDDRFDFIKAKENKTAAAAVAVAVAPDKSPKMIKSCVGGISGQPDTVEEHSGYDGDCETEKKPKVDSGINKSSQKQGSSTSKPRYRAAFHVVRPKDETNVYSASNPNEASPYVKNHDEKSPDENSADEKSTDEKNRDIRDDVWQKLQVVRAKLKQPSEKIDKIRPKNQQQSAPHSEPMVSDQLLAAKREKWAAERGLRPHQSRIIHPNELETIDIRATPAEMAADPELKDYAVTPAKDDDFDWDHLEDIDIPAADSLPANEVATTHRRRCRFDLDNDNLAIPDVPCHEVCKAEPLFGRALDKGLQVTLGVGAQALNAGIAIGGQVATAAEVGKMALRVGKRALNTGNTVGGSAVKVGAMALDMGQKLLLGGRRR